MTPVEPTPLSPETAAARTELSELASRYHAEGWLFGTSGNLSMKVPVEGQMRIVVTASGCDKARLTVEDFVEVDTEGQLLARGPNHRPSAETSIHLAVYQNIPEARTAVHVHTVASTLLETPADGGQSYDVSGYELVKGWGLWDPGAQALFPVFKNHPHVPDIAKEIAQYLAIEKDVPALLIERHGLTAWGDSAFTAHRHLEVAEFFCRLLRQRQSN